MFHLFVLHLSSNPSLRVAYIDEVEESEGGKVQKVYYSVLVKAVDNLDQVSDLQALNILINLRNVPLKLIIF